jgi:hypothetical protein
MFNLIEILSVDHYNMKILKGIILNNCPQLSKNSFLFDYCKVNNIDLIIN